MKKEKYIFSITSKKTKRWHLKKLIGAVKGTEIKDNGETFIIYVDFKKSAAIDVVKLILESLDCCDENRMLVPYSTSVGDFD